MVLFDFDQTNGKVSGLTGDDGWAIAPPLPAPSVQGFVQHLMGAGAAPRGASAVDRDKSVTAYSEEGAV